MCGAGTDGQLGTGNCLKDELYLTHVEDLQ
jgi:hypothetical protein